MVAFTRRRQDSTFHMVIEANRHAGILTQTQSDFCDQCEPFTPERLAEAEARKARAKAEELDWGRNKKR